jgi:hypothetical protein
VDPGKLPPTLPTYNALAQQLLQSDWGRSVPGTQDAALKLAEAAQALDLKQQAAQQELRHAAEMNALDWQHR